MINVEIAVPLKYLSNFRRTLEMFLISCKMSLNLTLSAECVICKADRATKFAITDTKGHVLVVTLSTQNNEKLLQQLKSKFKRTISCIKYLSKVSTQVQNQYLDYLIDPSFEGVNRLFLLLFENEAHRRGHTGYHLPTVEIKDYNVMTDGIIL